MQWQKNKGAFMHAGMRQDQILTISHHAAIIHQINIQNARLVALVACAPKLLFNPMQCRQRRRCSHFRFSQDHGIDEPGLVRNRHRRCFEPSGLIQNPDIMLGETPDRCRTSLLWRFITIRDEIGANSEDDAGGRSFH